MTDRGRSRSLVALRTWLMRKAVLVVVVIVPGVAASIYYSLVAADIYVSEARFIMRASQGSATGSGFANIVLPVELASLTRANDEAHLVNAYLTSRDAMANLVTNDGLFDVLARPEADALARFPRPWSRVSLEHLHARFAEFVSVSYEATTGISTLSVRTFRGEDSERIAKALLVYAEGLVNRLNGRARADAIRFATDVVEKAELRVADIQMRLTAFRNEEMVVDPSKQSVAVLELVNALFAESAQLKTALSETLASAPDSPRVGALRGRLQAIEAQIREQRTRIVGGDGSLASLMADYETLVLERELATKALTSALAALEQSRLEAQRQQLYLERIVEPHRPDFPAGPSRQLSILAVLGLCLSVYIIVTTLGRWVWEHEA